MHWIDAVLNPSILTRITEALKKSGARMTKKRAQILTAIGSFSRPVSAEEIRKQAGLPPSDLVTVYRNLEAFEAIQVLQRIPMESGAQLLRSGRIRTYDPCVPNAMRYQAALHSAMCIIFFLICSICRVSYRTQNS